MGKFIFCVALEILFCACFASADVELLTNGSNQSSVVFCCAFDFEDCLDDQNFNLTDLPEARNLPKDFNVSIGTPSCGEAEDEQSLLVHNESPWKFFANGSIEIDHEVFNHDGYCLSKNDSNYFTVICGQLSDDTSLDKARQIYPHIMLMSSIFLLMALLVYAVTKELQNLHGKCLMCYLAGLICSYLCFCMMNLIVDVLVGIESLCLAVGLIAHFSVFASFFWLQAMCFNVLSAPSKDFANKRRDRRRFFVCCAYAFGVPFVMTSVVAITESTSFGPAFATNGCWIRPDFTLYFLYFPIGSVIGLNLIAFALTAHKICKFQEEISNIRCGSSQTNSHHKKERSRFHLYLLLFGAMSVVWIVNILSWAVGNSLFMQVADVLSCFHGIFVFIVLMWRPKKFKDFQPAQSSSTFNSRQISSVSALRLANPRIHRHLEMKTITE